jgi:hypothetical protein
VVTFMPELDLICCRPSCHLSCCCRPGPAARATAASVQGAHKAPPLPLCRGAAVLPPGWAAGARPDQPERTRSSRPSQAGWARSRRASSGAAVFRRPAGS